MLDINSFYNYPFANGSTLKRYPIGYTSDGEKIVGQVYLRETDSSSSSLLTAWDRKTGKCDAGAEFDISLVPEYYVGVYEHSIGTLEAGIFTAAQVRAGTRAGAGVGHWKYLTKLPEQGSIKGSLVEAEKWLRKLV